MSVQALYVDPERGPYVSLLGAENCWGVERDAKLYAGPDRVVAHPPCGPWGTLKAFCTLQDPTCGPIAVEQVRRFGGVLEHPRGSSLWGECGMPKPGGRTFLFRPDEFTIEVDQCRWGHKAQKITWLFFSGIDPRNMPPIPPPRKPTHVVGPPPGYDPAEYAGRHLKKSERHITPPAFAQWLVDAVRTAA